MKRTLLIAASILCVGLVQAQDNKLWLGGSAMFNNYSNDAKTKISGGNFSPELGFFINEQIAVGLSLDITGNKVEEKNQNITVTTKTNEFAVMPFFRYYNELSENCSLYGQLAAGFGSGNSEVTGSGYKDTYSFFSAGISPGVQYWIHKNWSINAEWGALGFRADNDKGDVAGQDDFKSSNLTVGLNLSSISFGLNYHFLANKK